MNGATDTIVGIWDDEETAIFQKYRVAIRFLDRIMGGVPQKPEIIESWLRQRIIGGDEELKLTILKTLDELDYDIPADASYEEIMAAVKVVAAQRNGNTFRRNGHGLFLGGYQAKAMLKESTAILYPGGTGEDKHRWGATKKAPRSYLAERVFVDELEIPLGRDEPDGTHVQIGQVVTRQGPRSTLTYVDYCERPEIAFTVSSLEDSITAEQWKHILLLSQKGGLGAMRSLGHGTFKVTAFDRL